MPVRGLHFPDGAHLTAGESFFTLFDFLYYYGRFSILRVGTFCLGKKYPKTPGATEWFSAGALLFFLGHGPDLRQLRQRIAVHARLESLTLEEAGEYIYSRIREVGCTNTKLFSPAALEAIWSSSGGSPRTINVLCDHALVNAFAMGLDQVDMPSAQEAIQDVLFLRPSLREARRPGPYLIAGFEEHRDALDDSEPAPPAGQKGDSR